MLCVRIKSFHSFAIAKELQNCSFTYTLNISLHASPGFAALPAFSACEDENSTWLSLAILIHAEVDCFPPTIHCKFYRSLLAEQIWQNLFQPDDNISCHPYKDCVAAGSDSIQNTVHRQINVLHPFDNIFN